MSATSPNACAREGAVSVTSTAGIAAGGEVRR